MARPTLKIDPEQVVKLVQMGVAIVDVAEFFGCHRSVLHRRFRVEIRRGKALRKLALREAQWRAVEAGDVRMLIWLGKNELGQSDRVERRTTAVVDVEDAPPLPREVIGLAAELGREIRRSKG